MAARPFNSSVQAPDSAPCAAANINRVTLAADGAGSEQPIHTLEEFEPVAKGLAVFHRQAIKAIYYIFRLLRWRHRLALYNSIPLAVHPIIQTKGIA